MKDLEIQSLEKMEKLRKTLESHPLAKQIQAEEAAAVLATRTTAADSIKTIRQEQAEAIPRLLSDIDDKEKKFLSAKAAMESAGREYQQARAALSTENSNYSYRISHLEQALIESADPAIDEAKEYFNKKLEWLRSPGRISHGSIGSERNLYNDTVTVYEESNVSAVNDALQFCQAAIKELELMKLEPVLDLEKIERIKKAIPSIEVYTSETAEKPLPGSKGRSFESWFKSEDHSNFEVSKLLEKAGKLLSPAPRRARA